MTKIKAGIVGGAGYTGGELIRILLQHPQVQIAFAHSSSNAGNPISDIHTDLLGETDLTFASELQEDIDVLFLCSGHGTARAFMEKNTLPDHVKVIDLSQDYRIADGEHAFVYGLPELNGHAVREAQFIANPGCFATCIQLGLLPLAQKQWIHEDIHVNAVTGSTGAGQKLSDTSHFSWRNNNISVYKPFAHQHLKEINQSLKFFQPEMNRLHFIPVRGNFTRGILAAMYTPIAQSLAAVKEAYHSFYLNAPFVHLADSNPHLKQVVNTNKCLVHLEKHDDMLLVISMIDNLLKGASGQAVQNMNLMFGLEETAGLKLKASYF